MDDICNTIEEKNSLDQVMCLTAHPSSKPSHSFLPSKRPSSITSQKPSLSPLVTLSQIETSEKPTHNLSYA